MHPADVENLFIIHGKVSLINGFGQGVLGESCFLK